jgi:hypothetical protein
MPIKSRSVLACRETLAAGLMDTHFSTICTVDGRPETATVRASRAWWRDRQDLLGETTSELDLDIIAAHRGYNLVVPIAAGGIDDLRNRLLDRAWRDGAWDVTEHHYGPISGVELGIVSAHRRWLDAEREARSADAPRATLERWLTDAAQQGSLIVWAWRPMVANPHLAHWRKKDTTLAPDGSRTGELSYRCYPHAGCGYRYVLGVNPPKPLRPKRARPARGEPAATRRQREYITAILRRLHRGDEQVPNNMTRKQASSLIDSLLAQIKLGA